MTSRRSRRRCWAIFIVLLLATVPGQLLNFVSISPMATSFAFPLRLTFKLLAFASQFYVQDNSGTNVAYVKQKLFKFKEDITVFTDERQQDALFSIKADRVIDFSARYNLTDAQGQDLGAVKQRGLKSLWRAGFDVLDNDQVVFSINEKSVWTRFFDSLFGQIPVVGFLSGYLFQPAYEITAPDGALVMELTKKAALFEGRFDITLPDGAARLSGRQTNQLLLSLMMVVLLERSRG